MRALIILTLLFSPVLLFAHTSDERYADGYVVDLSTAPVAPWVGEKMGMSFVFRDPHTGLATSSIVSAEISIDALMREGNKRQEVVYESGRHNVVQGGFVTDFTFNEVGTYDIHLRFTDTSGTERETGFRKQVRSGDTGNVPVRAHAVFGVVVTLVAVGAFLLGKKF